MSGVEILGPFDVPGLTARRVRVFVPASYASAGVMYLFDGQNLFDDEPSFAGGWHLDEVVRGLGAAAPAIVGVDHGGQDRIHELGPWSTEHGSGKLDALLDWMTGWLAPELERTHGLVAPPERTGIGGSSLGGLAAMVAHHRHPERFGLALSMSPSFWYANGRIVDHIARSPRPRPSRIYLDAGLLEGPGLAARCARVVETLKGRGYGREDLLFHLDREGRHAEADWRRRAPRALRFLFSGAEERRRAA